MHIANIEINIIYRKIFASENKKKPRPFDQGKFRHRGWAKGDCSHKNNAYFFIRTKIINITIAIQIIIVSLCKSHHESSTTFPF